MLILLQFFNNTANTLLQGINPFDAYGLQKKEFYSPLNMVVKYSSLTGE